MGRLTANLARPNGRGSRLTAMESGEHKVSARSAPLPIPTGGLDSISPIANMPPDMAIQLDNWFPQPGYLELRRGHSQQCNTGRTGPVQSLMAYHAVNAVNDKLFAAIDSRIVDVTTSTPAIVVTGLTSTRLQHVNFATSGAQYLYVVNGVDAPRAWDGATWLTPTISGATASAFVNVAVFKNRLWFCSTNSLDATYLRPDSFQGDAFRFTLGGVFKKGGNLQAIGSWSLDGGDGPDDHIAFVSSRGEVAIYNGSDPTSGTNFNLVGVYEMGPPIGRRCLTKVGADLAVISIDGVLPLSKALITDRAAALKAAITANIQPTLNADARDFRDEFGWQLIGYPLGTRAILNVPQLENETQIQYVMNTITGAWCRFLGMNANCWEVFRDRIYFGGNSGRVFLADNGASDNGTAILADMSTAFNGLGDIQTIKHFTMARPFLTTDGEVSPSIAINVDYRNDALLESSTAVVMSSAQWDVAQWDVDQWPQEERLVADWGSIATQTGNVMSMRLQVSALGGGGGDIILRLNAIQVLYVPTEGGYI